MLITHFYERMDKMRLIYCGLTVTRQRIVWMFGKFEAGYMIGSLPLCIFRKYRWNEIIMFDIMKGYF